MHAIRSHIVAATSCLFWLLAVSACSSDKDENGAACGAGGSCPAGFVCDSRSNICVPGGAPSDARLPDGGPRDGGPAADAGGAAPPDAPRPASIALAPATQDFGAATLGSVMPPLTFTVDNRGDVATGALDAHLDDESSFKLAGGTCLGAALTGGAQCTVLVQFTPSGAAAARSATLTVTGTPGGSASAAVSGTALTPGSLALAPTSTTFDAQALATRSAPVVFAVQNTGQSASGAITVALSDDQDFAIAANDCPASLAAGASCSIGVAFTPARVGTIQGASLTVSGAPAALAGTGTAAVTLTNAGGGTVVSTPAGIDCDASCTATFTESPVTLRARPDAHHTFRGWAGACAGAGECKVTLDAASEGVTARFDVIPARLAIAPAVQSFGSVVLGGVSSPVVFTVTNGGGARTGTLATTVDDQADYVLSGGTCAGTTLEPGATCEIVAYFNPTGSAGAKLATLGVTATPGATATAALNGTALTAGALAIDPPGADFGAVPVGSVSAAHTFTITNSGQSPTGAPTASLTDASPFRLLANGCSAALAAGASCTVSVAFAPGAVGAAQGASLTVMAAPGGNVAAGLGGVGTAHVKVSNAGGGTVVSMPDGVSCGATCEATFTRAPVILTATADARHTFGGWQGACSGTDPCRLALDAAENAVTALFDLRAAALTLAPATQSFGSVVLGSASAPITFTATNVGGATTAALAASVSDDTSYDVTGGTCAGATLASGATCTAIVRFAPSGASGAKPATLSVTAGAGVSATSSLSGTALTVGALALAPAAKDYGAQAIGSATAPTTFTVHNTGGSPTGNLTVSLSSSTDFTITSNGCAAPLAAGGSCAIAVAFKPSSAGAKQGVALTVSGTPGGSVAAALSGTGTALVRVANAGGGTVTSFPDGISCGATCMATFGAAPVKLTAAPDAQHTFGSWLGACTGTGPCNLPLASAITDVTARFDLVPTALAMAPASQSFGSIVLGAASSPVTFTVSNGGGATSGTLSASVSDGADYSVTGGTCQGTTLPSGASCTVIARFNPTGTAGPKPATLTVSGGAGQSATAALSGTALTVGALAMTPTSKDFGPVGIGGASGATTFTVQNSGQSPTGTLATTLSDTTNFTITANGCSAALAAGASCTLGVAFKPGSVGVKQGVTLTVTATPGGSQTATLRGAGTAQVMVQNLGGGTVTSTPGGISCGGACSAAFSEAPTLRAVADATHTFTSWEGGGCSGTADCQVALTAASVTVKANFQALPACQFVTVDTFVGDGRKLHFDGQGLNSSTAFPSGITVDANGVLYMYEIGDVRKILPDGTIGTMASTNGVPSGDGIFSNGGRLLTASSNEFRSEIDKLTLGAGNAMTFSFIAGGPDGFADGKGADAKFIFGFPGSPPVGVVGWGDVTVTPQGTIFVADSTNRRIRKVLEDGTVTTFAGDGTAAILGNPTGLTSDEAGNLFVADAGAHRIRKIDTSGVVSTLAGNGTAGDIDAKGDQAELNFPKGITRDGAGNLYVTEVGGHRIRKIAPDGTVSTLAGSSAGYTAGVTSGCAAQFNLPFGIVYFGGKLFISDRFNNRVRTIDLP